MDFRGDRLLALRTEKFGTQRRLSEASGVTITAISRYETENRQPNIENLMRLARALGCTTDYLLGHVE
jgi:transcriptional regulator with XRE-family HTH domain